MGDDGNPAADVDLATADFRKIQTVILASPDIDLDVFRSQLQTFGKARPAILRFHFAGTARCASSRRIAGNIERLGAVDPDANPWLVSEGIAVVDLTDTGWQLDAGTCQIRRKIRMPYASPAHR